MDSLMFRHRQLTDLHEHLKRGHNVVVQGEAGSGKTMLARHALERAGLDDQKVKWVIATRDLDIGEFERLLLEGKAPTVIVVDEAERLKPDIIERLFRLDIQVLLVGTGAIAGTGARLGDDFALIEVGPLSREEAQTLVEQWEQTAGRTLSTDEVDFLLRDSGGNLRAFAKALSQVATGHPSGSILVTVDVEDVARADILDLLLAMNSLYQALGGEQLVIREGEIREFTLTSALV